MKLKRIVSLLTVLILVIAATLTFAACDTEEEETVTETGIIYTLKKDTSLSGEGYYGHATVKKYVLDEEHLEYLESGNYADHLLSVEIASEYTDPKTGYKYKVTAIDDGAFANQLLIEKVVVPSSIETIGGGFLSGCNNLKELTVPFAGNKVGAKNEKKNLAYVFGTTSSIGSYSCVAYHNSGDNDNTTAFFVPSSLKKITVTGDVISEYAFSGLDVEEIVISSAEITEIPEGAFYGVRGIREITLPTSITKIGNYAFKNSTSVYRINLQALTGLTSVGIEAFYGCSNLGYSDNYTFTLPSTVSAIGKNAFYNCVELVNVDFSATAITAVPEDAFYGCSKLAQVKLPAGVTIAKGAFLSCDKLEKENFLIGGATITADEKYAGVFNYDFFD